MGDNGWKLTVGNIKVWNMPKAFNGIPWTGSMGSKSTGLMMIPLICAYDIKTIIEIGICNAFTTSILSRGLSVGCEEKGHLISCDINEQSCNMASAITAGLPIKHDVICGDSRKINWKNCVDKADLCFIDGDHAYEACYDDIKNCLEVDPRFIVVHDYNHGMPGVVNAAKELLSSWNELVIPERPCIDGDGGDLQSGIFYRGYVL